MMTGEIFHMCKRADWLSAQTSGVYMGSGDDLRDGFMHFSTAAQVAESAARHRAGVADLVLIAVNADDLGPALKWESSRGGQLFPHLYGPLDITRVASAAPLPVGDDGYHVFPPGIAPWRPAQGKPV